MASSYNFGAVSRFGIIESAGCRIRQLRSRMADSEGDLAAYKLLVGSVFSSPTSIIGSNIVGALVPLFCWHVTADRTFLYVGIATALAVAWRISTVLRFRGGDHANDTLAQTRRWDRNYFAGATLFSALLGLNCYAALTITDSQPAHIVAVVATIAFASGFVARNAGRPGFVIVQLLCLCVPTVFGFGRAEEPYYGLIAAFICLYILTNVSIIFSIKRNLLELAASNRERKAVEHALRVSEERLALAVDASCDGLWDWNIATGEVWFGDGFHAMLGYGPGELTPARNCWTSIIHPDDRSEVARALDEHFSAERQIYECENRLLRKDGTWIWTLDKGKVVARDGEGRPLRAVGTTSDITSRKASEQALAHAKAAAEEARKEAERASEAKTEFLANMSHEIRTPLNSILGHADLLLGDPDLTPSQQHHANRVQGAGSALLTVVDDILDFSKIEAGQLELEAHPFSPATLIEDAADMVRGMADRKGLALIVHVDDDIPDVLLGDNNRVRQVLVNLLNNAVKFTPSGEVVLRAECVKRNLQSCALRFSVTDTGIGITPDQQSGLFQRFSQLDGSIQRRFGGTGLGLAISKRLVQMMGGEIGVQSREGQGSQFWFLVWMPRAEHLESCESPEQKVRAGRARVLLVDDNEINQEIASTVLRMAGHHVDVVSDGTEAIMAVQAAPYDVVLMDIQMPNMGGMTATQHIRALDHPARNLPIIAMTANVLPQQVIQYHAAGMVDHVAKPFEKNELYAAVERWAKPASRPS